MKIPSQFRDGLLIGGTPADRGDKVEVCESFSFKMNLQHYGGRPYESCDLFSSRKMSCTYEAREMVSAELFEECVADVRANVKRIADETQRKAAGRSERMAG